MIKKTPFVRRIKQSVLYIATALLIPLPWFLISFYYTGNPIYPLFSQLGLRGFTTDLLAPVNFLKTTIGIFIYAPDPIGPIYMLLLPIVLLTGRKLFSKHFILIMYAIFSYLIWYLTSQEGGSRFLTSYLPAYSLISVIALSYFNNKKIVQISIISIIIVSTSSLIYRGIANSKYLPVIVGIQPKQDFLMKNLNFSYGDFYDENKEIERIVGSKIVLLWNVHNIYYVHFNFITELPKDLKNIHYVLVQNYKRPKILDKATIVYKNSKTHVTLYKL